MNMVNTEVAAISKTTVFIVDDNPANTLMLRQVIEAEDFEAVHVFNDPQQALEAFDVVKPQLVLLDLLMPKIDGIEFLRRIHQAIQNADVAVIILTASYDTEQRMQALELGAQDFIEKPLNIIETLQRIRNVLHLQQRKSTFQHLSKDLGGRLHKTTKDLSDVILTLNSIFDNSSEYVFVTNDKGVVSDCNKMASQRFGIHASSNINLFERFKMDEQLLGAEKPELTLHDQHNKRIIVEVSYSKVVLNRFSNYVFVFKDITHRKEDEINLKYLAETHYITHLPNRNQTQNLTEAKIDALDEGERLSFIFISYFDNNRVAALYGYDRLEYLLLNIALALVEIAAQTDAVLVHWGDNDFLIVEESKDAAKLLGHIIDRFERPIQIGDLKERGVYSRPTVGVYTADAASSNDETKLLTNIHCALQATFEGARVARHLIVYDEELQQKIAYRNMIEKELLQAIGDQSFKLAYQPKVDLTTGKVVSAEALIRWPHRELGMIGPNVFIPIAESCGLINEIGAWVLKQVFDDIDKLKMTYPDIRHVALNVAAPQLDESFIALLKALIGRREQDMAGFIELEITETSFLDDLERVGPILQQIKDLGCRLALDDFGTGYSSLSYLHELPVDTLKIDRSFILPILKSERSLSMVISIVSMSLALDLEVVAEGIEDQQTAALLRDHGVQIGQGFYFYKPEFLLE